MRRGEGCTGTMGGVRGEGGIGGEGDMGSRGGGR